MKISSASTCQPRWFRVGPGLVIAIIGALFIYQRAPLQRTDTLRTVPLASEIVRNERTVENESAFPAAPDPDWLWSQREVWGLEAGQMHKLQKLHARWQRDTRALRAELARATKQFEREMAREKASPDTLQVLAARGAPLAELSRQLAQAQRAWWNEARAIFSAEQRTQIENKWTRRFVKSAS